MAAMIRSLVGGLFVLLFFALEPTPAFAQLQPANVLSTDTIDAVAVRVTRFGPYPASIARKQGAFLLYVSNRSGAIVDTYSLLLAPASATSSAAAAVSLLDLHSDNTKNHDHELINPLPGDYELRFKSHPDWVVSITITAN